MRPAALALLASLVVCPGIAAAVECREPHYREAEKTTLSLVGRRPTFTTISEMLTSWAVPGIYGWADKCTRRRGRELTNYYLYGWARRRKAEPDGDWHIELTSSRTARVVDNCLVVEIPPASEGRRFQRARDQFTALAAAAGATIAPNGDLSTPVRVKVVGPAFFDGEHRGAQGASKPPHQHGRCNRDSRSLWEIHPVYGVFKP